VSQDDKPAPDVVDFDALHAALGDLPPPAPTSSSPIVTESQGRSSATYSSTRPHAIPTTRPPPPEALNAPAVIVATDDTVPSAPPRMTVPLAPFNVPGGRSSSPPHPLGAPAFAADAAAAPAENLQAAIQMAGPPRLRTPTVVVRTRGPTKQQKLLVFTAMLLVFVAGGIAFLIYGKRFGLNIDIRALPAPRVPTVTTVAVPVSAPTLVPSASESVSALAATAPAPALASAPSASAAPSALPTVSVKKVTRPREPREPRESRESR
jgi:hypothetical protein